MDRRNLAGQSGSIDRDIGKRFTSNRLLHRQLQISDLAPLLHRPFYAMQKEAARSQPKRNALLFASMMTMGRGPVSDEVRPSPAYRCMFHARGVGL